MAIRNRRGGAVLGLPLFLRKGRGAAVRWRRVCFNRGLVIGGFCLLGVEEAHREGLLSAGFLYQIFNGALCLLV